MDMENRMPEQTPPTQEAQPAQENPSAQPEARENARPQPVNPQSYAQPRQAGYQQPAYSYQQPQYNQNPYQAAWQQGPYCQTPYSQGSFQCYGAYSPYTSLGNTQTGQFGGAQAYSPYPADAWAGQQTAQPAASDAPVKKTPGIWAGLAALAVLVAIACGITAVSTRAIYNRDNQALQQQVAEQEEKLAYMDELLKNQTLSYDQKLAAMQQKLDQAETLPSQGTGGELPAGMMTPAQLYANCVSSVVAITNQVESTGGSYTTAGTGSGFILTEDGYIVSNHHVIEGAQKLVVTLSNGLHYDAQLIGSDNINDVALLKIETKDALPAVVIGSSAQLQIGDQVVAIGNPLGDLTATATVGYISGKDRPVTTEGTLIDMLQTDAAINSGNSGGPLFNMYGQVVGITTAKYSGTTGSGASIEGIGFAIPIDDVYGMISDFKEHGFITGGYLGVVVSSVDPAYAGATGTPLGAYVREVTEGSCAKKAGVQAEDIIVNLGGYDLENLSDLTRALRNFKAGDKVSIQVYRDGEILTLSAVLDEKPVS